MVYATTCFNVTFLGMSDIKWFNFLKNGQPHGYIVFHGGIMWLQCYTCWFAFLKLFHIYESLFIFTWFHSYLYAASQLSLCNIVFGFLNKCNLLYCLLLLKQRLILANKTFLEWQDIPLHSHETTWFVLKRNKREFMQWYIHFS